jgi:endonuclease/exonuclease/phosphatase family metal-dependent hydrolase
MKVGGGDLDSFIGDLRAGKFTGGKPVDHFVLLLQEAYRGGPAVPKDIPSQAMTGRSIRPAPPRGERRDIVAAASLHGLNLLYVPSMRNGNPDNPLPPEDRGNAILTSRPLLQATAVELPLERQRRVAIAAHVVLEAPSRETRRLLIINTHLENRARSSKFWRSFGSGRLHQIKALLKAVPPEGPTLLAGDFNTWFSGANESAIGYVEQFFDRSPTGTEMTEPPSSHKHPKWQLDYMFFRLPENWQVTYRRIDNRYGSDHYPLLAEIVIR